MHYYNSTSFVEQLVLPQLFSIFNTDLSVGSNNNNTEKWYHGLLLAPPEALA